VERIQSKNLKSEVVVETLNCRGLACPGPVLKSKDFIEAYPDVSEFMVVVDNAASCQNVVRFVTSRGYSTSIKQKGLTLRSRP